MEPQGRGNVPALHTPERNKRLGLRKTTLESRVHVSNSWAECRTKYRHRAEGEAFLLTFPLIGLSGNAVIRPNKSFRLVHAFDFGAFLHTRAGHSCGSLYFQREYGVHNRSASIHVEDLAGHPTRFLHADEHRCIRDVLRGPSSPRGTPSDFMPGFNRLLHLRWETNQYTAIDQVSCTEDDARAE